MTTNTTDFRVYDNGVIYLHVASTVPGGVYFANQLSDYLKENPGKVVKAITTYTCNGETIGYIVATN